jgi:uncharacterized protein YggU (UPF0235/DUF167 family)
MAPPPIRQDGPDVLLELTVQPRASRTELSWRSPDRLVLRLPAPPVEGAANLACREALADLLGLPKSRILIARGETARHKLLRIRGAEAAQVLARLPKFPA